MSRNGHFVAGARGDSEPDPADWADLDPRHPHYRPPKALPDPYKCDDPWCPSAPAKHQHGTRPDGKRV